MTGIPPREDDDVLTLDEPDLLHLEGGGAPPVDLLIPPDDALRWQQVFVAMRGWFDEAPRRRGRLDPDRLYRTHGDPRD